MKSIDTHDFLVALGVLLWLVVASHAGMRMRRVMPESYRSKETSTVLQAVILMQVTFAAIVLGVLISTAKSEFDDLGHVVQRYAVNLIEVDRDLREIGSPAAELRATLTAYVGTSAGRPWGRGNERTEVGDAAEAAARNGFDRQLITRVGSRQQGQRLDSVLHGLAQLTDLPAAVRAPRDHALQLMQQTIALRDAVIAQSGTGVNLPFYAALIFWFSVIFFMMGLLSPYNTLIHVVSVLGALTVCSAFFVMIEMRTPFGGLIQISKDPLLDALRYLRR
ncbi:bestrophin-like domain [Chitinasiproducens palmae]|uniref:DUF4239 domain-containing protein n=1 Tax=Chitinasiproducens palmae TaxID=1770053 RepID=A0A1H2PST6_9BURK|nr:hypothetical protein [Chitinasiproducens palmae]SDV50074.1 hypothetical protein SAMN05216551_11092 [Chitinasiproducens palmae]